MSEKKPITSQKVTFSNSFGTEIDEYKPSTLSLFFYFWEKTFFEYKKSLSAVTNPNFIPDNNPNDENNDSESISPSVSTNQNQVPSNQSEENIQSVPSSISVSQQPASDQTRKRFISN